MKRYQDASTFWTMKPKPKPWKPFKCQPQQADEEEEGRKIMLKIDEDNYGARASYPRPLPPPEGLVVAFDLFNHTIYIRLSKVLMIQGFNEGISGNPCVRVFLSEMSEPVELQGSIDGVDAMVWYETSSKDGS